MIHSDLNCFGLSTPASYVEGPVGPLAVYEQPGDGIPLVLIHGINMRAAVWADVVDLLGSRHIIALDLRGHGRSTHSGPFGVADYVADVLAVVDNRTYSRIQIAGVSLGGLAGCLIAQEKPELVQSVTAFGSALKGAHPDLEAGMSRLREVGVDEYFSQSLTQGALAESQELQRLISFATVGRAGVDVVESITRRGFGDDLAGIIQPSGRPVRVVTGEFDKTCTPEASRQLAAAAGGQSSIMPGVGHVIPIENPFECAAHITAALD